MRQRNNLIGFAFLAPNMTGFLVFTLIPVLAALVLSVFEWNLFQPAKFVGLRNFVDLLGFFRDEGTWYANDPRFWKYLANTMFLMVNIPICMSASLLLAIILNQKIRGRVFFRTLFYLPTICSGIGIMLLWMWIYNPEFGLANRLLALVGIEGPLWLKSYHWAKPS
ncbi:MAG: sugar ABC transporter permease, partial [Lentisphaeria bacterium]|nr:sugar ABC transporter permease [Lentisphaeria bacterium]